MASRFYIHITELVVTMAGYRREESNKRPISDGVHPSYKIANDKAYYEWASEHFVIWKSTKRIPKRPAICNHKCAILMINKDYSHPIDVSEIPPHVSILVHESKASTAPTDRSYCIWSNDIAFRESPEPECLDYLVHEVRLVVPGMGPPGMAFDPPLFGVSMP